MLHVYSSARGEPESMGLMSLCYVSHDLNILTSVFQVNPEHYVFSTFGVLHVYPSDPAENLSLSDWQQEAVLFEATARIPFFKNYLILKAFRR